MSITSNILFILALSLVGGKGFSQETKSRVTVEDVKKYAIQNNLEIKALKHELQASEYAANRAAARFYPELGAAGGFENSISDEKVESGGIGYVYGRLNLFRGFADVNQVKRDKIATEINAHKLKVAEFQVGLAVEKYFHEYIFLKRLVSHTESAIGLNETQQKNVQRMRQSGLASEADVMEFELQDALLKSEIVSANQALEEARVNLKRFLGEEVGTKIEPAGDLMHEHLQGTLMDYIQKVHESNDAIVNATKVASLATQDVKLANAKLFPEIDFEVQSGLLPLDQRPEDDGMSTNLLLIAKYPLFSGLESTYARKEKISLELSAQEHLKDKILNVISEVETRYRRLKAIEKRVDLEKANSLRAKKYFDTVSKEYRAGVKNSADARNAASGVYEAATREDKFRYEFLIERIELEKALGSPVKTDVINDNSEEKAKS